MAFNNFNTEVCRCEIGTYSCTGLIACPEQSKGFAGLERYLVEDAQVRRADLPKIGDSGQINPWPFIRESFHAHAQLCR